MEMLAQLSRKVDEYNEEINKKLYTKFEDLNKEMKDQIHRFDAKVEGSLEPCEPRLDEIGGASLPSSMSQGCAEREKTDCDPLG